MAENVFAAAWIKKCHKGVYAVMPRRNSVRPSEQKARALAKLERAGFKIGPGVDLKMK